jgi:hypothetical protein
MGRLEKYWRMHAYANSHTYPDADSHTDAHTNANADSYTNPNAHTWHSYTCTSAGIRGADNQHAAVHDNQKLDSYCIQ